MLKNTTYKTMKTVIANYKAGKNDRTEEEIQIMLNKFLERDILTQENYDELCDLLTED